jgi:hypothetical protein
MELDEELAEEAERTVVSNWADADSLDNAEDVHMQSGDEEIKGLSEEIFELSTSEDNAKAKVVTKRRQVSSTSDVAEVTLTDVPS